MRTETYVRRQFKAPTARATFASLLSPRMGVDAQVAALESLSRGIPEGAQLADMAATLLERCHRVEGVPDNAVDLCGTGGDGSGTFNVSTVAAFVVAGAGFPVVKHGNRAISSRCGSVDCLEELGINTELQPADVVPFLDETGIAFLSARVFHPAVGAVTEARRILAAKGSKSVFNILGPLANPAGVRRRSVGVFHKELIMPVANALKQLGVRDALVYHGDGHDELALTGVTFLARLSCGEITLETMMPEDVGFKRCVAEELAGGSAADNARIAVDILEGRVSDARRDIVLLNAAAAIQLASDDEPSLRECVGRAINSIESGRAATVLARAVRRSQS